MQVCLRPWSGLKEFLRTLNTRLPAAGAVWESEGIFKRQSLSGGHTPWGVGFEGAQSHPTSCLASCSLLVNGNVICQLPAEDTSYHTSPVNADSPSGTINPRKNL